MLDFITRGSATTCCAFGPHVVVTTGSPSSTPASQLHAKRAPEGRRQTCDCDPSLERKCCMAWTSGATVWCVALMFQLRFLVVSLSLSVSLSLYLIHTYIYIYILYNYNIIIRERGREKDRYFYRYIFGSLTTTTNKQRQLRRSLGSISCASSALR